MALRERFEQEGEWLFRWRSYVPLVLLAILFGAFQGFHYPYMNHTLDQIWDLFCFAVALFGLSIRVITVGFVPGRTSGRNTGGQVADELNTSGMYSIVRHPLYFGNAWMWLGVSLFLHVWWCSLIVMLGFFLLYERVIMAEERFLRERFGEAFEEWASRTPAFWPRVRLWKKPALPFSVRAVLKRENSSLFAIVTLFFLFETIGDVVVEKKFEIDMVWLVIFLVGLVLYVTLKILKKMKVFRAEGR
jgi:protein-S-isoprenylcysteine O-methyltransferase Ste14